MNEDEDTGEEVCWCDVVWNGDGDRGGVELVESV